MMNTRQVFNALIAACITALLWQSAAEAGTGAALGSYTVDSPAATKNFKVTIDNGGVVAVTFSALPTAGVIK